MRVAELMTTDLVTARDDMPLPEAIGLLADAHVHALPVLDARGRFVGVLSSTDVLEAAAERAATPEPEEPSDPTPVREIMTPRPCTIGPDEDVTHAAQQMLYLDIHRLFVEYDGKLVGVISQSDIVRAVATGKI